MPEYPKLVAQYIWEMEPGWFTFTDETGQFNTILYPTIEDAQAVLNNYAAWLNQEKP
jgi:hypothetical protein